MDQILQLALQIGGNRLTTEAVNKAMSLLGLNQQQNNPLIFGLPDTNIPFMPKNINVGNILARTGINAASKSLLKGGFSSAALPLAAAGGLFYLARARDPLNPNSQNYNPYLRDELNYLSANNLIGTNIGPGQGFTRYNEDSVLRGKNVMSGFGTNSYRDMLNKYIANMEANEKISAAGKERKLRRAKKELADFELNQVNKELAKEEAERNKTLTNKMTTYQGAGDGASQANKGSSVGYTAADDRRESFRGRYGQGGLASLL